MKNQFERCAMNPDDFTKQEIMDAAENAYKAAIFEALMNYQAIEETLKSCIVTSYEILNKTSHASVTCCPDPKHIKDIQSNKGLGSLINIFKTLTPHKDLCDRLSKQVQNRNKIAHQAAVEYLRFSLSYETTDELRMKTDEIFEAAKMADWLYSEVFQVLQDLLTIHADIFELEKTLFGPN
jgi:hypothetical protein